MEGELCVGGLIQARGYLGLPARTAAAWIPNEFGRIGTRMYRTGDLCRIHPDGDVQVVGRYAHQFFFFLRVLELMIKSKSVDTESSSEKLSL